MRPLACHSTSAAAPRVVQQVHHARAWRRADRREQRRPGTPVYRRGLLIREIRLDARPGSGRSPGCCSRLAVASHGGV